MENLQNFVAFSEYMNFNKYLGIFEHVQIFLNIQTIAQRYWSSINLSWFCEKYLQKTRSDTYPLLQI